MRKRFVVRVADVDETPLPGEAAGDLATRLAVAKAVAASRLETAATTLGADTVVAVDGVPLGKPTDVVDARAMLRRLRGRRHHVLTAVALAEAGAVRDSTLARTDVVMRDYTDAEIDRYVDSGEPFDKAGGYAIQDNEFRPVERIDGCYPNVVGLPLCATATLLDGDATVDPTSCGWCRAARELFGQA